ncbi:MAG: hypothetical protein FH749_13745 [Firmicutes bacterium]|nr:hypothetical protein [Bacillota bacterium]
MNLELFLLSILLFHQTIGIIGLRGYVDRPELISPDTIGYALFVTLFVLYTIGLPASRLILTLLLGLVLVGFWHFHWKLYLFGASEKKITGYNRYFSGTHRILPASEARVVPDTYHIVHTLIIAVNLIVLTVTS